MAEQCRCHQREQWQRFAYDDDDNNQLSLVIGTVACLRIVFTVVKASRDFALALLSFAPLSLGPVKRPVASAPTVASHQKIRLISIFPDGNVSCVPVARNNGTAID